MSFNGYSQQQLDALSVGRTPGYFPVVFPYVPTSNFINFPIGQLWINTAANQLYYLEKFINSSGMTQAVWQLISSTGILSTISDNSNTPVSPSSSSSVPPNNIQLVAGSGVTIVATPASKLLTISATGAGSLTLTGDSGGAISPSANNFNVIGGVVAAGTSPLKTAGAGSTLTINAQKSQAISSADATKIGLSNFNSAQFQVDGNGFVSLQGSIVNPPVIGLTPDATSGTGTSPVVTDSSGNIKVTSASISNTGSYSTGLQTISSLPNNIAIELQFAGSNAASSTPNNFGIAQFDSNMFTVSSGFVQVKNGGTTGAVTKIQGDDSVSVVPTSGLITFDGVVVNNAINAKPVYFKQNATSIEELDIQVSTTSNLAGSSKTNAGLCSFNSAQFTVDGNGFVSATGGGGGGVTTLTGNSGGAVSPAAGNINTVGTGSITVVGTPLTNTLTAQLTGLTANNVLLGQGTSTIGLAAPGVSGTVLASNGVSSLPSFQTLGSLGATLSYTLDKATTPITPNGSGVIVLTGGQVAAGMVGNNVIQTMGNASNSCAIQIQRSTQNPTTNATLNGVAHFNSTSFTVDGNGFVSLAGGAGVFTLSDDVNTQVGPSAGNIQLTGHVVNASGNFSTTVSNAGSHLIAVNPMSVSRWIVDPLGFNGTHTTIGAALSAASSGEDIFIMPGTYNESPNLKAGVNLIAWGADAGLETTANVIIKGTCSFSSAGTVSLFGLQLQTNSANSLSVTGSAASIVNCNNCFFNCTNNTGINYSSSSSSSQIYLYNCNGDLGTTGIALFSSSSAGTLNIQNFSCTNSGISTTSSNASAGTVNISLSKFLIPFTASGTVSFNMNQVNIDTSAIVAIPLTWSTSTTAGLNFCSFTGGSNSSITIASSTTVFLRWCNCASTATNAIAGTGNVQIIGVAFPSTSSTIAPTLTGSFFNRFTQIYVGAVQILSGSGSPSGVVTAPQGSLWLRTDGSSSSTRAYINTNGGTTWTNISTAA